MRSFWGLILLVWAAAVHALSSSGNRLLVVQEEKGDKSKFSTLWKDLQSRGYELTFESPKSEELSLFLHGDRVYDHILLLPPKSKGYGPSLAPAEILKFVNAEGNVLLALSSGSPLPAAISSLLLEFGIQIPPERPTLVVDHFNYDSSSASEKHDVLALPRPGSLRTDVKSFFGGDGKIAFPRTVGQTLGNNSPLLAPILRAPRTAYTYNPKEELDGADDPFATGEQLALVSSMQARNNARFTVFGSLEALSDEWFSAKIKSSADGTSSKTANREFAKQVTAWTFKETGILKVGNVEHWLNEGASKRRPNSTEVNPSIYRIKNDVTLSIEMSEYSENKYIPFELPESDELQLEFTMLSPYHRLNLVPAEKTTNSTIFITSLTLPDQHGIFRFEVNYKRPFFSYIDEKRTVTVRHFAHNEWPRSWAISGAWVWIGGVWVTVAGWLAFVLLWLYSKPTGTATAAKKKQ